jgi:hypothetical protein
MWIGKMLGGPIPYVLTFDVTADVQYYLGAGILPTYFSGIPRPLETNEDHSPTSPNKFAIRGYGMRSEDFTAAVNG